jgi:5-methylcytosine-specific restriction endonuclease McrA
MRGAVRDPVTPEMYEHIRERDDYGCLGPSVGMPGPCDGRVELDHILNGGLSYRGPSVATNLASLCRSCHNRKDSDLQRWRPLLVAFVARREGAA